MIVKNQSKQTTLGGQITLADSFFARLKGLLGKKQLPEGQGILLSPCSGVHGIGMGFNCEAIYLSKKGEVLSIHTLAPNKLGPLIRKTHAVLEVPVGTVERTQTEAGDFLIWYTNTSL